MFLDVMYPSKLALKKKAHAKFKSTFNMHDYRYFSFFRARYKHKKHEFKKSHRGYVDKTEVSILPIISGSV